MNFKFFVAAFLFFAATDFATAKSYFPKNSISPNLISPALVIGSAEWQNEIAQVVKAQKNYDMDELDEAIAEKHLQPETIAQAIDPTITRAAYPQLYYLMDRVGDTSRCETDAVKDYWNQTRPYLADSRVKMLITPSRGGSYPSGHATGSYIYANILGLLFPQNRDKYFAYADKIGAHRVTIGMHYPRDIAAGKTLSFLIVGGLTQSAEFRKDFQKALSEIESKKTSSK